MEGRSSIVEAPRLQPYTRTFQFTIPSPLPYLLDPLYILKLQ